MQYNTVAYNLYLIRFDLYRHFNFSCLYIYLFCFIFIHFFTFHIILKQSKCHKTQFPGIHKHSDSDSLELYDNKYITWYAYSSISYRIVFGYFMVSSSLRNSPASGKIVISFRLKKKTQHIYKCQGIAPSYEARK